jgi:hypothetical protein
MEAKANLFGRKFYPLYEAMPIESNIFYPFKEHTISFASKLLLHWKQILFACKQILFACKQNILSVGSNVDTNEYLLHLFYGRNKRL